MAPTKVWPTGHALADGQPVTLNQDESDVAHWHQDLPTSRIVAQELQHTAAVLFSTCGAVLVVVADGSCRCGGVECVSRWN